MDWIAGVDGCPGGWVAVREDLATGDVSVAVYPDAQSLFREDWGLVAIDIPIGLTDAGRRRADVEARKMLRPLRHCSVFPAPVRPAMRAKSREQASEITRSIDGRGVGAQAFGIFSRINDVDRALCASVRLRRTVREVHPEVCFAAMNGGTPLRFPKRTVEGHAERRTLIDEHFRPQNWASLRPQITLWNHLRPQVSKSACADDDLADAFAALWTCRRILRGQAVSLPSPAEIDSCGLLSAIWY